MGRQLGGRAAEVLGEGVLNTSTSVFEMSAIGPTFTLSTIDDILAVCPVGGQMCGFCKFSALTFGRASEHHRTDGFAALRGTSLIKVAIPTCEVSFCMIDIDVRVLFISVQILDDSDESLYLDVVMYWIVYDAMMGMLICGQPRVYEPVPQLNYLDERPA